MTRSLRLTRRAEDRLVEIAHWTIERFGPRQADIYELELLALYKAVTKGEVRGRCCAKLVDDAVDLMFLRAGEHFLVFLERPDEIIVVDIPHSRSDLPRHVAALSALKGEGA